MHVICTAGHVDHGKSTLVRALTGMEPDRFVEERERGLTIDLGFAWADLERAGERHTVAFVDLPGHERFIGNMLAGAGAVRLALVVVAADEGVMPQTREHLDILDLLGVEDGVVAVTKTDTVDAETVELAIALLQEELDPRGLAAAPIVAVSAQTGEGLDDLTAALLDAIEKSPAEPDVGRPRLWVDRAFTISGTGTVVTGTLSGGSIGVSDAVEILPGGTSTRIRGVQSLKRSVDRAEPGTRVAVSLSGVGLNDVQRGDALGLPRDWLPVVALDALVDVLGGHELGRRGAWHLHTGSAERLATLHPLMGRPFTGGGLVRVELDRPVALTAGDRFVLREAGRRATVAGGVVLDPLPPARPRGRQRPGRVAELDLRAATLAAHDLGGLLACHVSERGAAEKRTTGPATGLSPEGVRTAVNEHNLLDLGSWWAHPDSVAVWLDAVLTALRSHHVANPLDRVAPKDLAVRAALDAGCPSEAVTALLDALVERGELGTERGGLRDPSHAVELDPKQSAARQAILDALAAQPFSPPRLSEAAESTGASVALIRELEAAGELVRLEQDLAVVTSALDGAVDRLRAAYEAEGPLTAARAKEVLGTSRRYALPLLEHLDRTGRTQRHGDVRIIR